MNLLRAVGMRQYLVAASLLGISSSAAHAAQTPLLVSCAPVATLTTATAVPGAVVCPIAVQTSDGLPFAGTFLFSTGSTYFQVKPTTFPANLVILKGGMPAATYSPVIYAYAAAGSPYVKATITVPIASVGSPPPPPPPPPPSASNTITLTDASGAGETNYPFQFGRPFIDGAIPHAPHVLINGAPVASQAD